MDPITLAIVNILVGLAVSFVGNLAQQAFAPKRQQQQQQAQGLRTTVQSGGEVPQSFLVGTIGVAGKLEYRGTWGNSGQTPNAYAADVLTFGDLTISSSTPQALWVNSAPIVVSTGVATTAGFTVPSGDFAGYFWWQGFDGTQTVAPSYLTAVFGSDPDRPWLSDMIGRQLPVLITTALFEETVWNVLPSVVAQWQGIPLYDPRFDTTAGGSGSQRRATPSTWAFSDNPIVIVYNILRGIHDADGNHVWGGRRSAYQLPYAVWAAAMDACDEDFALADGGTEKRFRAGREIFLNERPADVIEEFLIGANARIAQAGGQWFVLVGAPGSADGGFTDADVLISESISQTPFPGIDDVINGATATYMEPSQAWEFKETAPYYRSDLETADGGRRLAQQLKLTTTFSGTQAQRVLKATVEEGRRFLRFVVALPPVFGAYRPLNVLAWTSDRYQYSAKLFLIASKTTAPNGNVILTLQEIDPNDHDWTTSDESGLSFAPLTRVLPPAQPMAGFAVSPYTFRDGGSNARRPGILLEYTGAMPDIAWVAFEVRLDGGVDPVATGTIQYDRVNTSAAQPIGGQWTLPNTAYEVRAKFLPVSARSTDWSSWLDVTTPNVLLGVGDIDFDAVAADIAVSLDWVSRGVREAIANFERLGTLIAEQDLANFNDRESLKRSLTRKLGDLEGSFNEIIEVALGPGGAIAAALSSLYAAMGGNTAEVNVRWEAKAAPTGYTARYAVEAAVDDGSFRAAAFGVDVPASDLDPTRFWVNADQSIFVSGDLTQQHQVVLFDAGGAYIPTVRFQTLRSIAESGGNPVVEIDGDTGAFSFGAP